MCVGIEVCCCLFSFPFFLNSLLYYTLRSGPLAQHMGPCTAQCKCSPPGPALKSCFSSSSTAFTFSQSVYLWLTHTQQQNWLEKATEATHRQPTSASAGRNASGRSPPPPVLHHVSLHRWPGINWNVTVHNLEVTLCYLCLSLEEEMLFPPNSVEHQRLA